MKVFDKIKDLFTEEVVEVKSEEEPVKKEVIQVEIKAPEIAKKEVVEEIEDDGIPLEQVKELTPKEEKEEKNNFPVFFDENDFDDIKRNEYEERREPIGYHKETKEPIDYGYKESYNPKKDEKKKFSPTPIISPIYGVLDKNYKKDDIISKPKRVHTNDANMTIDDVRNKAYGTLEDELESTLFGKTSIMFASKEEKIDYDDLEEELKETADALDLLREDPMLMNINDNYVHTNDKYEEKNDSIDDLLNKEFDVEKEDDLLDRDFKSDDKLSESDLFNLIDDMYEKGDK